MRLSFGQVAYTRYVRGLPKVKSRTIRDLSKGQSRTLREVEKIYVGPKNQFSV